MANDQSGTDNHDQNDNGAAVGGADDKGAQGASGNGDQGAQDKKLAAEAAKWRTELRKKEAEFVTLKTEYDEFKSKSTASPGEDKGELAKIQRTVSTLQNELKVEREKREKAENASNEERLTNAFRKVATDLKLLNVEDAIILARTKGKARIAADGKPVVYINEGGEEREVEITADVIKTHKLVPENFFPAEGFGGAGSRGGARGGQNQSGVDLERAKTDMQYYTDNRDKIIAERKRLASAR